MEKLIKNGKFFNGKIKFKRKSLSGGPAYDYDLEIENGSVYKGKKIEDGKLIFEGYFKKSTIMSINVKVENSIIKMENYILKENLDLRGMEYFMI